ncbi:MAG: flavodoxin domain-containing protein [Coriobacteriia bacterium]|nr:flavodoxin domain-containing protein [Coriobacteriia bacterium]
MPVLVAYASRHGATRGVAETVADELRAQGVDVDVTPVERAPAVEGYDGAVIGSAVYNARWMPEAVRFIERNREALRRMPHAYFQVCLSILGDSPRKERIIEAWMEPPAEIAEPISAVTFPGAIDRAKLEAGERLLVWLSRVPDGDYRDWPAIRAWAASLAPEFLKVRV